MSGENSFFEMKKRKREKTSFHFDDYIFVILLIAVLQFLFAINYLHLISLRGKENGS